MKPIFTISHDMLRHRAAMLLMFLIASFSQTIPARDYTPEEVVNPNLADYRQFVADPENLLDPTVKDRVNARLLALRDSTTAEVAVAIVPSIGDDTSEDFAERLFMDWGLGKKDRDNGLLILISPESHVARIQTGYGLEGAVPDIVAGGIIREKIVPAMREGDLNRAVDGSTEAVARIVSDPAYAVELRSRLADNRSGRGMQLRAIDPSLFMNLLGLVVATMFVASAVVFFSTVRKAKEKSPFEKAVIWRGKLLTMWLLALVSAGIGIVFALMAQWRYRHARDGKRKCPNCGHAMKKLDEAKDNEYLTPAQDLEEKLGSVDYDVWLCPECGTTEVFPFPQDQTYYKPCPRCGAVAYHEAGTRMVSAPTRYSAGVGEKVFRCENCGFENRKRFNIPRKSEDSAAAALGAAAIFGAMSGRGGGGGFGGGGFGGGSTGGGGASGSW